MDLTTYLSSLREDLTTTASAGDEQTKRAAAILSAALEPSARLAIMNALSDLAAEVTASLDDHVVDVRLDGREVRVVVTNTAPQREITQDEQDTYIEPDDDPPMPPPGDGGDISRITLRLFEELKSQAEQAAAQQGLSLNSFVANAVQGALQGRGQRRGPGGFRGPRGPGGHGGLGSHGRGHEGRGRGSRGPGSHGHGRGRGGWDNGPWSDWPSGGGPGGARLHGWVTG